MLSMKTAVRIAIILLAGIAGAASYATGQDGSIEFVAHATPTGGLEEPVRGFPFYLLSKSFADINKEADADVPKPDMGAFIDKLDVSKELKAWMKKNHWVNLSGDDFLHRLQPADVLDVPEFYNAYLQRNSGYPGMDFPKPKYKPEDKTQNPAKYAKLSAEYKDALRHYIEQNPTSIDGIDLNLANIDPSPKWRDLEARRGPEVRRRVLDLSESKYLVAQTQTNLQGQGSLRDIPPGNYWLSTLDVTADVGDARPRWDTLVTVRPGEATHITLSNVNAVQPSVSTP
jgi:hypothetical protein